MQKNSAFLEDLSRFATSATTSLLDMKREMEASLSARMESWLRSRNLVSREEFEVVRLMAEAARAENEELRRRIADLEAKTRA